ncbi:glycoside hydrolase family 12 protein [Phlebiopsis gigantea 11061_1 CR5-6]|uniref:Glycoside hydrolase family 12 protein n=1 Tax=Phlebiopsis gigantea (strain 11061_1 CR5-6) TaxID=745531 RepID=A0A0C3NRX3_PHLG1|nr:glycoside hydrolase family 12 protein [Phlebiopsis gigantea 11061_1 CR5-6]
MFKFLLALGLASLLKLVSAQTISGQYDCMPAGDYTLCQNLWGESAGVGGQNSTLISTNGNAVSWQTNWTWADAPNNVKSCQYSYRLGTIQSAPTAWNWTYVTESEGIRADVSYDIWFGKAQSGTAASSASSYEIMIWLSGQGGIQPVGSQILSGLNIAGNTWNLWSGPNANWQVLSFVISSGEVRNFNADLNEFFQYLIESQGVASTQYLQAIQVGTEPFVGSASLLTESFSVSVSV